MKYRFSSELVFFRGLYFYTILQIRSKATVLLWRINYLTILNDNLIIQRFRILVLIKYSDDWNIFPLSVYFSTRKISNLILKIVFHKAELACKFSTIKICVTIVCFLPFWNLVWSKKRVASMHVSDSLHIRISFVLLFQLFVYFCSFMILR